MSPLRAYCEALLDEEPPETPRVPYTPSPPSWMVEPVPTFDMHGNPLAWTDEAPRKEWEERLGQAAYELMLEDHRDQVRVEAEAQHGAAGTWAREQEERERRTLVSRLQVVINHPARLLTVQQREQHRRTGPWGRKPVVHPDAEELPEAEMCWAPWHFER